LRLLFFDDRLDKDLSIDFIFDPFYTTPSLIKPEKKKSSQKQCEKSKDAEGDNQEGPHLDPSSLL
jgi:hypothetical protein